MKTVKFLVPCLAFFFAIVAAFVTNARVNDVLIFGRPEITVGPPPTCGDLIEVDCDNSSEFVCTIAGVKYRDEECVTYLRKPVED